jgi:hypothetical protein
MDINNLKLGSYQYRNVVHHNDMYSLRNRQILFSVVDPMDHGLHSRCQTGMCICHSRFRRHHICATRRLSLFSDWPWNGCFVNASGPCVTAARRTPKANRYTGSLPFRLPSTRSLRIVDCLNMTNTIAPKMPSRTSSTMGYTLILHIRAD